MFLVDTYDLAYSHFLRDKTSGTVDIYEPNITLYACKHIQTHTQTHVHTPKKKKKKKRTFSYSEHYSNKF